MFEQLLLLHCSPTLAGIKTANLFLYHYPTKGELEVCLEKWNRLLNHKGVFVAPLRITLDACLIYVFRPSRLASDWSCPAVCSYLKQHGYFIENLPACIDLLSKKLQQEKNFPHEIGFFLGYPYHDVIGFIENKGKNCKYCGYWKVYCNEQETIGLFHRYQKCTTLYCSYHSRGTPIHELTVAESVERL